MCVCVYVFFSDHSLYISFNELYFNNGTSFIDQSMSGAAFNSPTIKRGKGFGALQLNGNNQYIEFTSNNSLFLNPMLCPRGFSLYVWVYFHSLSASHQFVFSTSSPDSVLYGFALYTHFNVLRATVTVDNSYWDTHYTISPRRWYHVGINWHPEKSLKLYIDGQKKSEQDTSQTSVYGFSGENTTTLFGRDKDNHYFANVIIDELTFYDFFRYTDLSREFYQNQRKSLNLMCGSRFEHADHHHRSYSTEETCLRYFLVILK